MAPIRKFLAPSCQTPRFSTPYWIHVLKGTKAWYVLNIESIKPNVEIYIIWKSWGATTPSRRYYWRPPGVVIIGATVINLTLWRTLQNVIQTQKCLPNQKNQFWTSVFSKVSGPTWPNWPTDQRTNRQFFPTFRDQPQQKTLNSTLPCVQPQQDHLELQISN